MWQVSGLPCRMLLILCKASYWNQWILSSVLLIAFRTLWNCGSCFFFFKVSPSFLSSLTGAESPQAKSVIFGPPELRPTRLQWLCFYQFSLRFFSMLKRRLSCFHILQKNNISNHISLSWTNCWVWPHIPSEVQITTLPAASSLYN